MFSKRVLLLVSLILLGAGADLHAALQWEETTKFVATNPGAGKVTARFEFTNSGSYPVKITGLKTTCGCTAADSEKRVIEPGEKGTVTVAYNTVGRRGLHEAPITVKTDDAAAPEKLLRFRVLIRDVLALDPTFVFWKRDEPLTPKRINVKVTEGFPVKKISASSSEAQVSLRVETVKPGSEYAIIVTPPASADRLKAKLTIVPDYPADGSKVFPAYVRVH